MSKPSAKSPDFPVTSYAVAFDVGGTKTAMAVIDDQGDVVQRSEIPTGHGNAARMTAALLAEFAASAADVYKTVVGIGIGLAAQVHPMTGAITGSDDNIQGWAGIDLRNVVGRDSGLPVIFGNDANVAAVGEGWVGAAAGLRDFICVTLGTGIGAGIVCGGAVVTGAWGGAGEIGHMPVRLDGPPCYCGSWGCLEMLVAGPQLVARARSLGCAVDRGGDLFLLAEGGDAKASMVVDEAAADLSVAVVSLVNILQPEAIIFGGGLAPFVSKTWLPAVRSAIERRALPSNRGVKVGLAMLGNDAGLLGAARMALEHAEG